MTNLNDDEIREIVRGGIYSALEELANKYDGDVKKEKDNFDYKLIAANLTQRVTVTEDESSGDYKIKIKLEGLSEYSRRHEDMFLEEYIKKNYIHKMEKGPLPQKIKRILRHKDIVMITNKRVYTKKQSAITCKILKKHLRSRYEYTTQPERLKTKVKRKVKKVFTDLLLKPNYILVQKESLDKLLALRN